VQDATTVTPSPVVPRQKQSGLNVKVPSLLQKQLPPSLLSQASMGEATQGIFAPFTARNVHWSRRHIPFNGSVPVNSIDVHCVSVGEKLSLLGQLGAHVCVVVAVAVGNGVVDVGLPVDVDVVVCVVVVDPNVC
jgi:hypothetical protein